MIVRDIDVVNFGGDAADVIAGIQDVTLFWLVQVGTSSPGFHAQWSGRQVLNEGETFEILTSIGNVYASVSGYLLSGGS